MAEDQEDQAAINRAEWRNQANGSGGLVGIYFSKKDSRVWVPKKIPDLGWTVNWAHAAGARWLIVLLLLPLFSTLIVLIVVVATAAGG